MKLPTIFLPHGGGPCFFMNPGDRPDPVWWPMEDYLTGLVADLPERPRAILLIRGHWEERHLTVHVGDRTRLYFDYSNFPPHPYGLLRYDPGAPAVAGYVPGWDRMDGFLQVGDIERGWGTE